VARRARALGSGGRRRGRAYSHAEIAEILGVAEGTVRSEVFHARRRLRVLLADWKEEDA